MPANDVSQNPLRIPMLDGLSSEQTTGGQKLSVISTRYSLQRSLLVSVPAELVRGLGDGFADVVAHNPTVKKAISKEKLTKRGLVSLLDYYLKVAHV